MTHRIIDIPIPSDIWKSAPPELPSNETPLLQLQQLPEEVREHFQQIQKERDLA